jgi:hypothetical protein
VVIVVVLERAVAVRHRRDHRDVHREQRCEQEPHPAYVTAPASGVK